MKPGWRRVWVGLFAVVPVAALLAVGGGAGADPAVREFTDPANDVFSSYADVRSWRVAYGDTTLSLAVTVASGAAKNSNTWVQRYLGSLTYIDTNGDGNPEWELWLTSLWNELYWSLWPAGQRNKSFPSGPAPTCMAVATTGGNDYGMAVPTAQCLGSPASLRLASVFTHNTDPNVADCGACVNDYYPDLQAWSPSIAREPGTTPSTAYPSTTATGSGSPSPPPTKPPSSTRAGYWMVSEAGHVYGFGDAGYMGGTDALAGAIVDIETFGDGQGYWVLARSGRVTAYGAAGHFGDRWRTVWPLGEWATSISAKADGSGYWIFSNRGRVFNYGTAAHKGDMSGTTLNGPVLGSVATPSGNGYYMVASDGGIFSFGDAAFAGSMGGQHLNKPVTGLVPDGDGRGYWLVATDGGVFAFDAPFRGSMGGTRLNQPINGMVRFGDGYLMVASDGGVFNFSNKPFFGSLGNQQVPAPIVGAAAFGT